MQSKTESESDSNSISKIFEISGLTQIASNGSLRKRDAKWVIRCNRCNEPVTRKQALMVYTIKILSKFRKIYARY